MASNSRATQSGGDGFVDIFIHEEAIAALQVIKERNQGVANENERDWVSVITFDKKEGVAFAQELTSDYENAMQACTTLQAVADDEASTATESGLRAAKQDLASPDEGGVALHEQGGRVCDGRPLEPLLQQRWHDQQPKGRPPQRRLDGE
jgi:hypothetical protein